MLMLYTQYEELPKNIRKMTSGQGQIVVTVRYMLNYLEATVHNTHANRKKI